MTTEETKFEKKHNVLDTQNRYGVLSRKYRPLTFEDVRAQDQVVQIFKNAIESNKISQAYLLTGPRGVGKTSIARIIAKSLNCKSFDNPTITPCNKCPICFDISTGNCLDVSEIDGASNTGVDDVRELQREMLYATSSSRYKIIIIDEVHMLSKSAFNALLKTLEEPPIDNIVFIFATTEAHKVLPTIISRCQRFDLKKIPIEDIVKRLKEVSEIEKISIDEEALYPIAKKADGGMRDALSLLDQVRSFCVAHITFKNVETIFGLVGYEVFNTFMDSILRNSPQEIITEYHKISDKGLDIHDFINSFLDYLRHFLYLKLNINKEGIEKNALEKMSELVKSFSEDEILYIINYLIETKNNLRLSATPDILAELTFIKLAKITEMKSLKSILDTLSSGKLTLEYSNQIGREQAIMTSQQSTTITNQTNTAPINIPTTTLPKTNPILEIQEVGERSVVSPTNEACGVGGDGEGNSQKDDTLVPNSSIPPKEIDTPQPIQDSINEAPTQYNQITTITALTEDFLKLHWTAIIDQVKVEFPLSATYFETCKIKNISNNTIFFTHTSSIVINKLLLDKKNFENLFTTIIKINIKLSFEHNSETKMPSIPTIDDIQKEDPEIADFINETNSDIRLG